MDRRDAPVGQTWLWEALHGDGDKASRCRPPRGSRDAGRGGIVPYLPQKRAREGVGGCVHGVLRSGVESLPAPSAAGRARPGTRSPGKRPAAAPECRGQGPAASPARCSPTRSVGTAPKPLQDDELFKAVICQALMSPDRACEN